NRPSSAGRAPTVDPLGPADRPLDPLRELNRGGVGAHFWSSPAPHRAPLLATLAPPTHGHPTSSRSATANISHAIAPFQTVLFWHAACSWEVEPSIQPGLTGKEVAMAEVSIRPRAWQQGGFDECLA